MARSHTMTPARRAALRKAQLASARKRRKSGVGSSAKKAIRQRASYARASASLPGAKNKRRKALKYTAVGLGAATAAVSLAGAASVNKKINTHNKSGAPKIKGKQRMKYTAHGLGAPAIVAHDAYRKRRAKKEYKRTAKA